MAVAKGLSNLIRQAGQDAKREIASTRVVDGYVRSSDNIFSVLDYIESEWGLNMTLFPAQRFIVKLYYFLELDDTLPEEDHLRIKVRDVLTGRVKYSFTEKEYLTYLYNEGRCNISDQDHERRELLLAIGRRAGKCVTGDTLVLTNEGVRLIGAMGEAPEDDFSPLEVTVAQEGSRRASSAYFYNGGIKPVFRVTTQSGYAIGGTGNHRVKVMSEDGTIQWRYLDSLKFGDYVAIHRGTDLWSESYVDVTPYHGESSGRKEFDLPNVLDEVWGTLLGYLVGDGSWGHTQGVAMTVEHPETWEFAKELFEAAFGSYRVQMDRRTEGTGRLECPGVQARKFLDALGWTLDCGRYDKQIPWVIFESPKSVVCAFLRGLFETDGCAESGGRHITFSTASPRLAAEVQVLLLNLGIVSNVSQKWNAKTKRYYSNLSIKGVRSRRAFARWVGFDSEKKQRPLLEALETAQEGKSDTESIPHQYQRVRDLLESVPKRNPAKGELGWGRSLLRQALGNVCKPTAKENLTYSRLEKALEVAKTLGADTKHFEGLRDLDYFFDPVVAIREGEEEQVYDLNVPDGQSFVANGLVNHNTTLSGIFASYEVYRLLNLYNPQAYYGLPNGNRIQIISVATDKDQAGILFNEVAGHLAKCDYFTPYQANNTQSQVNFRTPYDIEKFGDIYRENGKFTSFSGKASVRLTFKGASGKGLRGAGNIVIIMDEFAHFLDTGPASADRIYNAVTPSAAAFSPKDPKNPLLAVGTKESRVICISSPLGKSGKFFNLYDQAMRGGRGSENMLAIQAPTWEINPTVPLGDLQQAYYADPTNFSVEYGANFNDQLVGWIEREEDLLDCVDPDHRPVMRARPKIPHQMGIDVGLVNDGTYIVITHVEDGRIVLDYHEGWQAKVDWRELNPHLHGQFSTDYAKTLKEQERLDFDEIAKWIYVISRRFKIRQGLFDRWNGIPLEQALVKKGLKQFVSEHFTRDQTSKMFQSTKLMMFNKTLKLYDYPLPKKSDALLRVAGGPSEHSAPIQELLSLRSKMVSKNIVVVEAPQKTGSHDDFSDAFVRSVWLSILEMKNEKHVTHSGGIYSHHAATGAALASHQLRQTRLHGVAPRTVPRAGARRGMLRYVR